MFWILVLAAIMAVVVAFLLSKKTECQCPTKTTTTEPTPKFGKNLGSPLFEKDDGKKEIVSYLAADESVWVLTPYGPQLFTVTKVAHPDAHLRNAEFESIAFYDVNYLSDSLAKKMGRGQGAWRIQTILPIQTPAVPANDPRHEAANRHWLEDGYNFGDNFFDAMIFYHFLFDGFDQPYTYYDMYETPVYEDPIFEEPVVVEEPVEEVPAEPTEETFEKGIGDEPTPPAPEPTPPAPEPTPPAPEPYTPPESSGGDYDSGGGGGDF